jgi:CheY-like chemotaxis protein
MPNEKILVVEGEAIVAKDIQNTLKSLGYNAPAIALSGEEAINKSEEINPDLLFMGIVLKGEMDGIEAAEKIRNHFNIPVVYLAAYMDEKTLQRAETTGLFGYILKPFEERELHATIETTLYRFRDLK